MSENYFPQLLEVAKRLKFRSTIETYSLSVEEYPPIVDLDREAMQNARELLRRPCFTTLRWEADSYNDHLERYQWLAPLTRILQMESKVLFHRSDVLEATAVALDVFRIGSILRSGGLVTDMLTGNIAQQIAVDVLRTHRRTLTGQCRDSVAGELLAHTKLRYDYQTIRERDNAWEAATTPETLQEHDDQVKQLATLPCCTGFSSQEPHDRQGLATLKLLCLELLLFDYQETHSCYPRELREAVPPEAADLLVDPYSKQQFCYRTQGNGFVLYSVGPKQWDAAGKFGHFIEVNSYLVDLCLDMRDYPEPDEASLLAAFAALYRPTVVQRIAMLVRKIFGFAPQVVTRK